MRSEVVKSGARARSPKTRPCTSDSRGCEIAELFRVLGKTYMLDILHIFLVDSNGPKRFVQLQERLGISPNTLADRLKELVAAGFLTRTPIPNKIPPWVDYEATEKAKDLHTVFDSLIEWAARHDLRALPVAEKTEKEAKVEA